MNLNDGLVKEGRKERGGEFGQGWVGCCWNMSFELSWYVRWDGRVGGGIREDGEGEMDDAWR